MRKPNRNRVVAVRMTEAEYQLLTERAQQERRSVSALLREACRKPVCGECGGIGYVYKHSANLTTTSVLSQPCPNGCKALTMNFGRSVGCTTYTVASYGLFHA